MPAPLYQHVFICHVIAQNGVSCIVLHDVDPFSHELALLNTKSESFRTGSVVRVEVHVVEEISVT